MPSTIAAVTTRNASTARPPGGGGEHRPSSRTMSAERATPKIRIEKTVVTPMPATSDATTVSRSSFVSTTVASHPSLLRRQRLLPQPAGEDDSAGAAIPRAETITGPAAPLPKSWQKP